MVNISSVPVPSPTRNTGHAQPDRLYVMVPGLSRNHSRTLSRDAAALARSLCPKLSGEGASGIDMYYGEGFFGIKWADPHVWYQNSGIKPFTMKTLAGKTIGMWIDDPTGTEARKNPKAETRITVNGRRQIKIFRKVAKPGQRRQRPVRNSQGRIVRWREGPASYPGAPGRISHREFKDVVGLTGRIYRLSSRPHVGVRWRHPGLVPREFLQYSLQGVGIANGIENIQVQATYRRR